MGMESGIQTAVLIYLSMLENQGKCYVVRVNSFAGHLTRANGSQGYVKNNKLGCPDILLCYNGKFIGLEIKHKTKQSEHQKLAELSIQKAGGEYYIIHDVLEVRELIK
jgi:hypothetical protein